jgi:hypothetical protein
MKIGEAIAERDFLNTRLDALGSRLTVDVTQGRPLTLLIEKIEQASNQVLVLQDAIDWTLQHLAVSQRALGSYLNRSDRLERVANLLENSTSSDPDLRGKIDALYDAKKADDLLVQTIYWAYDLQTPELEVSEEPEEE